MTLLRDRSSCVNRAHRESGDTETPYRHDPGRRFAIIARSRSLRVDLCDDKDRTIAPRLLWIAIK